ncbi:MAG: phosphopantetheine adenylyltransferase [Halobacteriota archaeon]|nr:phosphopantetheine adenylyltransferase [Halobacteriota archaeon]
MRVVLGGTFGPLHDGHKALLSKAFELSEGGEVVIGITSDEMARVRDRAVPPYNVRAANLMQFIDREFEKEAAIIEIDDPYGVTLSEDFDFLVASEETYQMSLKINEERRRRGMSEIKIVKVDHVLAEDGRPISSTRIKRGEIDKHGALL